MDKIDWVMVFATLLGPILAVQAQKAVEKYRERRMRKERVFERLMATRAARLSPEHVQALNMIDLVFYGGAKRSKKEQAVLGAWKEYLDLLSEDFARMTEVQQQAHWSKADDLFVNLLEKMASDLGLAFDRVQLKKGAYSPLAHGRSEQAQRQLMEALVKSFSGQQPLKMELAGVPDREAMQRSQQILERIAEAIERGVQVK